MKVLIGQFIIRQKCSWTSRAIWQNDTKYFSQFYSKQKILLGWMTRSKIWLREKNYLFQSQRKSGNLDFAISNSLPQDISNAITSSKLKYHKRLVNKLNGSIIAPKTY